MRSVLSRKDQIISLEEKELFIQLMLPLRNRLIQFARAITDTKEEADDLVGETLLVGLQGFHKLRDKKAFLSWLFTIASRIQRRTRKRGERFQRYSQTTDPEVVPSSERSPDIEPDIEALYKALEQLPEKTTRSNCTSRNLRSSLGRDSGDTGRFSFRREDATFSRTQTFSPTAWC